MHQPDNIKPYAYSFDGIVGSLVAGPLWVNVGHFDAEYFFFRPDLVGNGVHPDCMRPTVVYARVEVDAVPRLPGFPSLSTFS